MQQLSPSGSLIFHCKHPSCPMTQTQRIRCYATGFLSQGQKPESQSQGASWDREQSALEQGSQCFDAHLLTAWMLLPQRGFSRDTASSPCMASLPFTPGSYAIPTAGRGTKEQSPPGCTWGQDCGEPYGLRSPPYKAGAQFRQSLGCSCLFHHQTLMRRKEKPSQSWKGRSTNTGMSHE